MNAIVNALKIVDQKIEDLLKKETVLKKRDSRNELDYQETLESEGVQALLSDLKEQRKFWQNEFSKTQPTSNKPSISFSKANFDHCVKKDGLALNVSFIQNTIIPSFHIPEYAPAPAPSKWLCKTLTFIHKFWVLNNEKACRIVIDAILTEVL